ncbi:uncharacterized protein LOC114400376 [Glycine soja]|uniref:uncharacterized protein LOC114400376 n=1 Tax=Glycine soja TaxID=3848 RepID=UPI00103AF8EE|nr:uncharacterized protein LOC114400376 [Glycine soja]
MTLQLADHSITRSFGVVEDVLVKVHQLTFLVDFVIMDIEENAEIPLILGRPFMLTAKCVMEMGNDNLEMSVEDQKATFNLFEAIEHPKEDEAKLVVNPVDSSSVFLGPKQVRTRATPNIPPALPPIPPSWSIPTDEEPPPSLLLAAPSQVAWSGV